MQPSENPQSSAAFSERLGGGDRRSTGQSEAVTAEVLADPELFGALFSCLFSDNALVRMRAADALEKITQQQPGWLQPYKEQLLALAAQAQQQEVRWHLAQMLPRLELSTGERLAAVEAMKAYLHDRSRIVCTFAMQALADLALQQASLVEGVAAVIAEAAKAGSPAMRSRGKKLLQQLKRSAPGH